jgi:hypothetical protein
MSPDFEDIYHLVLLTREDPLLPIAQLRAKGEVLEIPLDQTRARAAAPGSWAWSNAFPLESTP